MVFVVDARVVLGVGLGGRSDALGELPIRLVCTESAADAVQWLRSHGTIDALISLWDLPDMTDGELVRRIKSARPWLPTVVLLDEPYREREVRVRGTGITAILPSNVDEALFRRVVAQMLGLETALTADGPPSAPTAHKRGASAAPRSSINGPGRAIPAAAD